jgi:hypothetical protein
MFARLAPKLRDMGWQSLLPLHNPGKAPLLNGWQRYNATTPTDFEIERWSSWWSHAGIGLAMGPDHVLAVDLDIKDPAKALGARAAAFDTLGETPLVRIGEHPKSMLFYHRPSEMKLTGRAFGGFEIYTRTGQVVLFSTHPDTGRPYTWPEASPEDVSPEDLPLVTEAQIAAFHEAVAPYKPEPKKTAPGLASPGTGLPAGTTREALRLISNAADPIAAAAAAIANAAEGTRYYSMVALVSALTVKGYRPEDYQDAITSAYEEATGRTTGVPQAIAWALRTFSDGEPPPEPFDLSAIAWKPRGGGA